MLWPRFLKDTVSWANSMELFPSALRWYAPQEWDRDSDVGFCNIVLPSCLMILFTPFQIMSVAISHKAFPSEYSLEAQYFDALPQEISFSINSTNQLILTFVCSAQTPEIRACTPDCLPGTSLHVRLHWNLKDNTSGSEPDHFIPSLFHFLWTTKPSHGVKGRKDVQVSSPKIVPTLT